MSIKKVSLSAKTVNNDSDFQSLILAGKAEGMFFHSAMFRDGGSSDSVRLVMCDVERWKDLKFIPAGNNDVTFVSNVNELLKSGEYDSIIDFHLPPGTWHGYAILGNEVKNDLPKQNEYAVIKLTRSEEITEFAKSQLDKEH